MGPTLWCLVRVAWIVSVLCAKKLPKRYWFESVQAILDDKHTGTSIKWEQWERKVKVNIIWYDEKRFLGKVQRKRNNEVKFAAWTSYSDCVLSHMISRKVGLTASKSLQDSCCSSPNIMDGNTKNSIVVQWVQWHNCEFSDMNDFCWLEQWVQWYEWFLLTATVSWVIWMIFVVLSSEFSGMNDFCWLEQDAFVN